MSESIGKGMAWLPTGVVQLRMMAHPTLSDLQQATMRVDGDLSKTSTPVGLLVDCSQMNGYDADARTFFVQWSRTARARLRRMAVVTDRPLWHMVVAGMAFASGQAMRAFGTRASALSWLDAHKTASAPA
jgi:hypothetical protein